MEPKAIKKANRQKKIRACKTGSALQAIGVIEKNTDTFVLTYGQFSLIDALMAVLDQTGPAHVVISTWTAAHAHLDKSAEMMESAEILSLRMIVDRSFQSRQPIYYQHMVDIFGRDSIRAIRTHAKFMLIRNERFDIVVRTSMNLNENPRLENIEISESADFADFFEGITDDIFSEIPPGENRSAMPGLKTIPDAPSFKLVEAAHLKRRNLNEPRYTHATQNESSGETGPG